MTVRIELHTSVYDTSVPDPSDSWDRANTRTELNDVTAHFSDRSSDESMRGYYGSETFDVEPDDHGFVYVVIARYSTGDTFGNDDGHARVMDVFNEIEKAEKLTEVLEGTVDQPSGNVSAFSATFEEREYYLPWVGYFERLERIEVQAVRVR